jgi:hypothetical protein
MIPQVVEFVLTELKHKIAWKSKDIPFCSANQLFSFNTV